MAIQEKRLARRLRVNLPIIYHRLGDERHNGETVAKDISITGLRINANSFFPPETPYVVTMKFPEVNKVIESIARVIWSHRISFSDQYQAGLQFTEISPVYKKWLEEYIIISEALEH